MNVVTVMAIIKIAIPANDIAPTVSQVFHESVSGFALPRRTPTNPPTNKKANTDTSNSNTLPTAISDLFPSAEGKYTGSGRDNPNTARPKKINP